MDATHHYLINKI